MLQNQPFDNKWVSSPKKEKKEKKKLIIVNDFKQES
jgi:hypothetical protein